MPGRVVRGTVLDVNLDPTVGHEQRKTRPCVVIQNNIGNKYSPTSIVAVITGAEHVQRTFPVIVPVKKGDGGLRKDSVVLCNQIRTVDEMRFGRVYVDLPPILRQVVKTQNPLNGELSHGIVTKAVHQGV